MAELMPKEGSRIDRYLDELQRSRPDVEARIRSLVQDPAVQRSVRETADFVRERGAALVEDALRATSAFVEAFGTAIPTNWARLTNPQIFAAVDLMRDTGWSLVWTPPAETIVALLEAQGLEARREILLGGEMEILADLDRLLTGIAEPEAAVLRDATRESLETYRSGFFFASQALSASVLSATLHQHFAQRRYKKLRELLREADERETSIREFRWIAVQLAAARTLDDFDPVTRLPEHEDFNRHASVHGMGRPQFGQVNALTALMLVCALLIEVDELGRGSS